MMPSPPLKRRQLKEVIDVPKFVLEDKTTAMALPYVSKVTIKLFKNKELGCVVIYDTYSNEEIGYIWLKKDKIKVSGKMTANTIVLKDVGDPKEVMQ